MTQRTTSPQALPITQPRVTDDVRVALALTLVLVITLITVLTGAGNGFA